MVTSDRSYSGQCLCGAIRYRIDGELAAPHACHCGQCRRQSGHFVAATSTKRAKLELVGEEFLKWYRSSPTAKRGFCAECGTPLFWDDGSDEIGINAGNLDQPTGLKLSSHIFVDEKADYYEISDGLPQFAGFDTPVVTSKT